MHGSSGMNFSHAEITGVKEQTVTSRVRISTSPTNGRWRRWNRCSCWRAALIYLHARDDRDRAIADGLDTIAGMARVERSTREALSIGNRVRKRPQSTED
jgi:hypothetical protein